MYRYPARPCMHTLGWCRPLQQRAILESSFAGVATITGATGRQSTHTYIHTLKLIIVLSFDFGVKVVVKCRPMARRCLACVLASIGDPSTTRYDTVAKSR